MKKYVVATVEYEEFNLDSIDSNDIKVIRNYLDNWSNDELSLGLPLAVIAYEMCDDDGAVQGIVFVVEDME